MPNKYFHLKKRQTYERIIYSNFTIIQNVIILWNYLELTKLIIRSDNKAKEEIMFNILNASILAWRHVNLLGTYDFSNLISHNDNEISHEDILNYKAA
jgi:hypothetical protein